VGGGGLEGKKWRYSGVLGKELRQKKTWGRLLYIQEEKAKKGGKWKTNACEKASDCRKRMQIKRKNYK